MGSYLIILHFSQVSAVAGRKPSAIRILLQGFPKAVDRLGRNAVSPPRQTKALLTRMALI